MYYVQTKFRKFLTGWCSFVQHDRITHVGLKVVFFHAVYFYFLAILPSPKWTTRLNTYQKVVEENLWITYILGHRLFSKHIDFFGPLFLHGFWVLKFWHHIVVGLIGPETTRSFENLSPKLFAPLRSRHF